MHEIRVMHHIDAAVGLAGVEIETYIFRENETIPKTERLFLSANELKYLINILKNSPILDQLNNNQDWT